MVGREIVRVVIVAALLVAALVAAVAAVVLFLGISVFQVVAAVAGVAWAAAVLRLVGTRV